MKIRTFALVSLILSAGACSEAVELSPGPGAELAPPGPGEGAIAEAAGIDVEVRTDAWAGTPADLDDVITPLLIEITNNSPRPLLIRYESVRLVQNGQVYRAMPPYVVDGHMTEVFAVYDYPYDRFEVAPHLRSYYPRLQVADPFWYEGTFYSRMLPHYSSISLPTRDMIETALPEGVLEPGGKIAGFVYFEDLDHDDWDVMFKADFIDPKGGQVFGRVEIPLVAH